MQLLVVQSMDALNVKKRYGSCWKFFPWNIPRFLGIYVLDTLTSSNIMSCILSFIYERPVKCKTVNVICAKYVKI
jgi:hypothetical protein